MSTTEPTFTIENTDSGKWLVTVSNAISSSDDEYVEFCTAVPKSDKPLPAIGREAAQRAIELLQEYLAHAPK